MILDCEQSGAWIRLYPAMGCVDRRSLLATSVHLFAVHSSIEILAHSDPVQWFHNSVAGPLIVQRGRFLNHTLHFAA